LSFIFLNLEKGIAKFTSTHATGTQTMVGTATYVAPEVCDSQKYGMKSDIWSLGCVLYEMCALERAFGGHNAIAIIKKISEANYQKLREDLPYSMDLRKLINSLLQKDPRQRPSSEALDEIHLPKILESINSKRKRIDDLLLSNDLYEDYHSHLFTFSADQWSMQFKRGLPKGLNIMDIGSGDRHTLILDVNNVVYGVGSNDLGQLGFGSQMPRIENPVPVKFSTNRPVQAIGTGADFSVFLMNKMVFTCGNGEYGCLGHGKEHKSSMFPNMVQDLISYDVVKISAGYKHVLALTSDGNVYSWGCGELGRLGHGGQGSEFSPRKITSFREKIKEIYAGYDSSFFIGMSGNMYVCGSNRDNKIGLQKRSMLDIFRLGHSRIPPYKDTPVLSRQLNHNQTISKISQARDHTVFLTSTGKEDSRFIITRSRFLFTQVVNI
jgi:NIMA (never in mitosis gene a)-related kinase 8